MMEVGAMRQRITIQKATVTTDEIGNRKNAWTDYHTCFAYVNLSSGKECEAAGQTLPGDTLAFTIRWNGHEQENANWRSCLCGYGRTGRIP